MAKVKVWNTEIEVPDWAVEGLENLEDEEKAFVAMWRIYHDIGEDYGAIAEIKAELAGGYYDVGADEAHQNIRRYEESIREESAVLNELMRAMKDKYWIAEIKNMLRHMEEL